MTEARDSSEIGRDGAAPDRNNEHPYPDSMFMPRGIPQRGRARMKYLALELIVALLFIGIYAMVLTRGQIVGW